MTRPQRPAASAGPAGDREPPGPSGDLIDTVAWWMDRAFRLPGTNMTVGLDALLELIPGVGDAVATLIQGALLLLIAQRYPRLPRTLLARMAVNIAVDCAVGTIPIVGDVFDAYFKANTRNVRLLRQARDEDLTGGRVASSSHAAFLVCVGLGLCFLAALVGTGAVLIVQALLDQLLAAKS